jgi:hypothetical protein
MKKSQFLDIFIGEYVLVIINLDVVESITVSEEGHTSPVNSKMSVEGFILDMDNEFIYMSNNGEEVTECFRREDLRYIKRIEVKDGYDHLMDAIEAPEDDKGYN